MRYISFILTMTIFFAIWIFFIGLGISLFGDIGGFLGIIFGLVMAGAWMLFSIDHCFI